jgi:hypothetical protein
MIFFKAIGARYLFSSSKELLPGGLLKRLYKDKHLSIPREASTKVIATVAQNNGKSDSELLEMIQGIANLEAKDFNQLGHALAKRSEVGKLYGMRMFKLAGIKGSLEGQFQYAQLLGTGIVVLS